MFLKGLPHTQRKLRYHSNAHFPCTDNDKNRLMYISEKSSGNGKDLLQIHASIRWVGTLSKSKRLLPCCQLQLTRQTSENVQMKKCLQAPACDYLGLFSCYQCFRSAATGVNLLYSANQFIIWLC